MYKVCVIDDDFQELEKISNKISELFIMNELNVTVSAFTNVLEVDKTENYDILFLDIDMPYESGIDFAKDYQLLHNDVIVIFITNYAEMVFKVFSVHPFDFIQKEKFNQDIQRTIKHVILKLHKQNQRVSFKFGHVINNLKVDEILYCESYDHTVFINLKDSRYQTRIKLTNVESMINSNAFFMVRKSYLVNWKYVTKIENGYVIFTTGFKIQISKRKLKGAIESFKRYLVRNI